MFKKRYNLFIGIIFISSLVSCEFSVTTAHIENVKMCSETFDNSCNGNMEIFETNTPNICVSCVLENAPDNTLVTFIWKYIYNDELKIIDEVTLSSADKGIHLNMQSSLSRPYNGWPAGDYQVEIVIEESQREPIIRSFQVQ